MIRINLLPAKRTAPRPGRAASRAASRGAVAPSSGQYILLTMVAGWLALGGLGYWLIDRELVRATELRAETKTVNDRVKEIRDLIDEEKLQALKDRVEQLRTAIEKLKAEQRTPAPLMNELTNILSTGKQPDIDEEEQRRRESEDPKAKLNQSWDASSVWIEELTETDSGVLEIEGGARDPSDLSEFVKRLRASRRFGKVTHPEYSDAHDAKSSRSPNETPLAFITFKLTAQVRYWD